MFENFKRGVSFTKKELKGLFVFCLLLVFVAFLPQIDAWLNPPQVFYYADFAKEISDFRASAKKVQDQKFNYSRKVGFAATDTRAPSVVYFPFDPNTLTEEGWYKLGLSQRQVRVVRNYVSKGGRFYKKEDLRKIYSISPADYERLSPYISIADKESYAQFVSGTRANKKEKPLRIVELNSADSAALESLNGIGPAFAARIIKYRNRLGGFHKKEQLLEVYGLDSAKYRNLEANIEVNRSDIVKLRLNAITFEEFKKFPYLSYRQMNAILQYRKQHGAFRSLEDLSKIGVLDDVILRKIEPYLDFK
ncbi:helix-hairpin-helix domain-containing protein [Pedobacter sp. SYSU D00535]|uniref:ComEA family DNA-binding protein n=1 Tax=Pedobacter sp. SYSU D00535 TaxID=2810308 RepID=UPI001A9638BF|nr:helix-hairpin-helix domain-containing protein [Pedobacter sp. SYSU D00535]